MNKFSARRKISRRVSIGITSAAEAALTSIPIDPASPRTTGEAWWLRMMLEEAIYATAEHYENGGAVCVPRFQLVPGRERRGIEREEAHEAVEGLLRSLA